MIEHDDRRNLHRAVARHARESCQRQPKTDPLTALCAAHTPWNPSAAKGSVFTCRRQIGQAMAIDPEALAASLREPGTGVVEALRQVTEACVDLFGVTGSGIMLADEQNVPHYVAASDGPGRMLEVAESDTGQGACTEAFVNNTVVASTDVTTEGRWPDLAAALRPHGVRAVLGLPVRLGGVTVGTLDVCYDHPHVWQENECQALARYRDVVESTCQCRGGP